MGLKVTAFWSIDRTIKSKWEGWRISGYLGSNWLMGSGVDSKSSVASVRFGEASCIRYNGEKDGVI